MVQIHYTDSNFEKLEIPIVPYKLIFSKHAIERAKEKNIPILAFVKSSDCFLIEKTVSDSGEIGVLIRLSGQKLDFCYALVLNGLNRDKWIVKTVFERKKTDWSGTNE